MYDTYNYAQILLQRLDTALSLLDAAKAVHTKAGDLMPPNTFSGGYALGYVHALSGAYDALPEYVLNTQTQEVITRAPED